MGIWNWIFGSKKSTKHEHKIDDDWGCINENQYESQRQSHGRGRFTSESGNSYERFNPATDIKDRSSYKIDVHFEVAGSFAREAQMQNLCDFLAKAEPDTTVTVSLEREPGNQYDKNAIRIFVGANGLVAQHVGYLPRDIAASIRDDLPVVELESIYQRRKIEARTLIKRTKKATKSD